MLAGQSEELEIYLDLFLSDHQYWWPTLRTSNMLVNNW